MSKSNQNEISSDLDDLPIEQFLTYKIVKLHMALNRQAIDILNRVCGLGLNEWRVLAMIGSEQALTNAELSNRMGLDKSIASRALGRLEKRELILLQRNMEDRRRIDMSITAKGKRIYRKTLPIMRSRQQRLLAVLDKSEREMVYSVMDKLMSVAETRDF